MNSIEEVYTRLKKYDTENNVILSDGGKAIKMELKNNKIIAFDDYISVVIKSRGILPEKQITHWHPDDYDEMYHDLLSILKERAELPTLKYIRKVQVKDALTIILPTIIAVIVSAIFKLDMFFLTIGLIIVFILLLILIIVVIKKLVIFIRIRTKKVNTEDMEAVKKYLIMPYPPYTHDLHMDLTFDYLGMVSSEFLKFPKRIRLSYPLEFCDEEIMDIEKVIKCKEKDIAAEKLYEYYQASLDIINIIYKYYEKNGVRKY